MIDKNFFKKNQRKLLWLANNWVGRRILCIEKDAPKIRRIDLNGYFWETADNKIGFDIRTHEKYGKRVYFAFKPLWWLCHQFDMFIANPMKPEWNLGWDTYGPFYPAAGSGGTTVDGYAQNSDTHVAWGTKHTSSGDTSNDTSATTILSWLGVSTQTDKYNSLRRGKFSFDASSIDDGATIDALTLSLWGTAKAATLVEGALHICAAGGANGTVVDSDFQASGDTSFGSIAYASYDSGDSQYSGITANQAGMDHLSLTTVTKYGTRVDPDMTGIEPSWISGTNLYYSSAMADETGTSNDPKITGTFGFPASGADKFFLMF